MNTQNQLTTTDGPAGSLALDPRSASVLLPCPFCGHAPRLKAGKVKCVNNQCKVQPKIAAWYAVGYDQNAIDDWNRRVLPNIVHEPHAPKKD